MCFSNFGGDHALLTDDAHGRNTYRSVEKLVYSKKMRVEIQPDTSDCLEGFKQY